MGLTGLSFASCGLGYRFWRSNADCAFIASYMHTSYHFPKLFPALAQFFPPILELVPVDGMPPPRAPSAAAALAARALARITAAAPLVHDRLVGAAAVMNHTQNTLSTIANEAETRRVISLVSGLDNPDLPRHMEPEHSNCGDTVTLSMVPSSSARLLLPISHVTRGGRRRCPGCHKESTRESSRDEPSRSVDEFGDNMLGCKSSLPTRARCGTTIRLRCGSCFPGWLACRAVKRCAT